MIKCKDLTKKYKSVEALKGVSFEVKGPGCFGFIGKNGSGKTTTIRILAGLAAATSGDVHIAGLNVKTEAKEVVKILGYLPQHPAFYEYMTGEEWLYFVADLHHVAQNQRKSRTDELLATCGLWDARKRKISGYSGGMKQRLGLAQALLNNPQILLLDEPVSALDPVGRYQVLKILEDLKKKHTIFMSSHILDDVEKIADHILILNEGKIVLSSPKQELMKQYSDLIIQFSVMEHIPGLKELLEQQEWVTDIADTFLSYKVNVNNLDLAKKQMPGLIYTAGGVITEYKIESPALEDIFMRVVN